MDRDTSLKKVIGEFSFILSLNQSHSQNSSGDRKSIECIQNFLIKARTDTSISETSEIIDVESIEYEEESKKYARNSSVKAIAKVKPNKSSIVSSQLNTISKDWCLDNSIVRFNPNLFSNMSEPFNYSSPIIFYDTDSERKKRNSFLNLSIADNLDKIILVLSGGYLLCVVGLVWGDTSNLLGNILDPQTTVEKTDIQFIDYINRSLDVIDLKFASNTNEEKTEKKEEKSVLYLPIYNISDNSLSPNSSADNLIPPPLPLPSTKNSTPATKIPLPPPPSESISQKTIPILPEKTVLEIPSEKELSTPELATSSPTIATAKITPKKQNILVGLMELEENSLALFKVNGVTQKFALGEVINNSGWVLKSIDNQQAVIDRQGETRTITIGEVVD